MTGLAALALTLAMAPGLRAPDLPVPPVEVFLGHGPPETLDAATWMLYSVDEDAELWSHNPDQRRPPASVTKVMTALLVAEEGDLDAWVVISETADATAIGYPGQPEVVAGETWSVLELLCHLRDTERVCFRARLQKIQAEENPFFPDWDQDLAAEQGDYSEEETREVLKAWRELRESTLRILEKTPPERWSRPGSHERRGTLTFEDIARYVLEHDIAHLGQILRNLADLRGPRGDRE